MKKLLVCVPALALAVVLSGNALAENGSISSNTLNDMGLAGIEMMSDADAMTVRGHGDPNPPPTRKPWNKTYGHSHASIDIGYSGHYGEINFSSYTKDGFSAEGKYLSGGQHFSEAKFDISVSETTDIGLGAVTTTKSLSIIISAGGASSAYSL